MSRSKPETHPALRSAYRRWEEILTEAAMDPANPWRLPCLRAIPTDHLEDYPECGKGIPRLMREALAFEDSSAICNLTPGLRGASPEEAFELADQLAAHPSASVRLALAKALIWRSIPFGVELGDLDPDHAIRLLEGLAKDEDPDVAWRALARLDDRDAFPEDFRIPPPPTAETADALAQDGLPRRRGLWRKGLEVPLLEAIDRQLLRFEERMNALRAPWIMLLADWMRLGGPEVDEVLRPWLGSENPMKRMTAALILGIHNSPIELEEFSQLSLAGSPLPGGETALRELLERADAAWEARGESRGREATEQPLSSMTEGDITTACLALTWRAIWDPLARLACERLNTPDFKSRGEDFGMGGSLFVESGFHDWIPDYPRDISQMPLLSALEPPLPSKAPDGVPQHLAIRVQALLAMAEDPEPSRAAWALGKLMMSADGPWLEAPMAAALSSSDPYLQTVGLLYLKYSHRFEELAAAIKKAPSFVLLDFMSISWYGLDKKPGWKAVRDQLLSHPDPKVRSKALHGSPPEEISLKRLQEGMPWELGYFLYENPMPGSLPLIQATLENLKNDVDEDRENRGVLRKALSRCPDEGTRELLAKELPHLPWDLTDVSPRAIMEAANNDSFFRRKRVPPGKILGLLKSPQSLHRLETCALSSNLAQRSDAVEGFALHPAPGCVKHLIALTKDPHPGLARKAIRALGCRPETEAIVHLKALMEDAEPARRKAAALGLLLSGPKEGARLLLMTLKRLDVPTDQMPFEGLADFGRALLRLV